jgi:hypothetical protein
MVHLLVLQGTPTTVQMGVQLAQRAGDGWSVLTLPNFAERMTTATVLVQSGHTPDVLRNFLGRQPNLEVLVARLEGDWATTGAGVLAGWLRDHQPFF